MNNSDKVGFILLAIGVFVHFVKFGFLIGFPIYIVGAIIVLFGKMKLIKKILIVVLPMVLLYTYYELIKYF